jgi:uroporphyrinogen-III decarboxylase
MIASGTNGIECLDPPPLGNIDLKEALEVISGRCFVKGNVDSVNVLLRGSRSDVVSDVRARLETARTTRGFILSTACSIAPRAPREHVMILREAVEATGSTHL